VLRAQLDSVRQPLFWSRIPRHLGEYLKDPIRITDAAQAAAAAAEELDVTSYAGDAMDDILLQEADILFVNTDGEEGD
jgi:hypothetical protein